MMKPKKGGGVGEEELHAAARSGDLKAVESIISSNPLTVNSRDKHSRTPLHLAAWSGHAQVLDCLCKHKADVGAAAMDDMAAIHFAAQKGHLEVVRVLLSSGASVKACTRKGLTPLHYAVQGSHLELVKYLVKKGANLKAKTKAGKTPLDLANSQEVCLYLEECKKAPSQGKEKEKEKTEQRDSDNSTSHDKPVNSDVNPTVADHDGKDDASNKRKGDDDANTKQAGSEPKKAKVALNHLLSMDDTENNEN